MDPVQTTQPENKATIIGGPMDNITTQSPGQPPAAPVASAQPPAAQPTQTPIIIGDRVFTDQAEALRFANDIAVERQRYLAQNQNPAPQPAPVKNNKIPLHQLLFEDPQAAIQELRSDLKQELRNEQSQAENVKNTWAGFYEEHKDLKGLEDAVELQRMKHWDRIQRLPVDQGLKFLAIEARSYISKIRGTANPGERVTSGSANVAGATGTPAPRVEIQAQGPSTFMDELKDFRNSKRANKQSKGA